MSLTQVQMRRPALVGGCPGTTATSRPRDVQRTFQLLLATVWLLDAVLQIQPFMFTPGADGFSGMIGGLAAGNPTWIAHTITWNASIVANHPVITNAAFALIQFVIAFGIVWRRSCKLALGLSIVWALGVWWFGEGLGGVLAGNGTPFGGGPGGVLFYALLAVLLWPRSGSDDEFVAARFLGRKGAQRVWVVTWCALAVLSVVGSGRSPQALQELVTGMASGQPGWLARLDRFSSSLFVHHGAAAAVVLAVVCVLVAVSVLLPPRLAQAGVVLAVVVFAFIWVAVQNFGGILAGGATDPNSGLLVILLALSYWPITSARSPVVARADSLGAETQVVPVSALREV